MNTFLGPKRGIRHNGGFTLVELIVVLVILGILAAFLVPALTGYIDKGQEKAVVSECRNAVTAAQTIYSEDYATGMVYNNTGPDMLTMQAIQDLSEMPGTIGNSIEADASNTILHLEYYTPGFLVIYCRHPANCPEHSLTYTVVRDDSLTNTPYVFYLRDQDGVPRAVAASGSLSDLEDNKVYNLRNQVFYIPEGEYTRADGTPYEAGYYLLGDNADFYAKWSVEENLQNIDGWNDVKRINLDAPIETYTYTRGATYTVGNVYYMVNDANPDGALVVFSHGTRPYGSTYTPPGSYNITNDKSYWLPLEKNKG